MAQTDLTTNENALNSNGTVTFASDVIATIAGLAAVDIPGVAGMSGGLVDGIAELLGKKNIAKGIKVEVGTQEVAIDIAMIVNYGVAIQEVAKNIQDSVINAVETMTGLKVVEVNINVLGISVSDEHLPPMVRPTPKNKPKQIEPRVK